MKSYQIDFGDKPINKIVYERNSDGFLKSKTLIPGIGIISKNSIEEATQKWLIEYVYYE